MSFLGDYDQVPPMYSALKVNGKKLYELARERAKRWSAQARRVTDPWTSRFYRNPSCPEVRLRCTCSKRHLYPDPLPGHR